MANTKFTPIEQRFLKEFRHELFETKDGFLNSYLESVKSYTECSIERDFIHLKEEIERIVKEDFIDFLSDKVSKEELLSKLKVEWTGHHKEQLFITLGYNGKN